MKPHKHAELIKAWADGAEIEIRRNEHWDWVYANKPDWSEVYEYRIQPEPKPDVVKYCLMEIDYGYDAKKFIEISADKNYGNLNKYIRIVWDGNTGLPKEVEILK